MIFFLICTLSGFLGADIAQFIFKTEASKENPINRIITSFTIGLFWTSLMFFIIY